MEAPRVTLLTLLCVVFCSQQRIFGAVVEMKVRPGENVIIYSDCVSDFGFNLVWFWNSSDGNQHRPLISRTDFMKSEFDPHYLMLWNPINKTMDLVIKKVTKLDMGLYFCSTEIMTGLHSYGNITTRFVLEEVTPSSREPSEPPAGENGSPGCSCSWQMLVSVSAVCVLLSSLFSSIGVYYLCRKNLKGQFKASHGESEGRQRQRRDEGVETEVCYSKLDFQNIKKKKQKQRVQHSDFSTYSEVRTQRT